MSMPTKTARTSVCNTMLPSSLADATTSWCAEASEDKQMTRGRAIYLFDAERQCAHGGVVCMQSTSRHDDAATPDAAMSSPDANSAARQYVVSRHDGDRDAPTHVSSEPVTT